jgi:hypothetical protein
MQQCIIGFVKLGWTWKSCAFKFSTNNFRYQTISSFTAPEPWILFQSRKMDHYLSAATFLPRRKQRACSVLDLVVLRTMAATRRSWNIASRLSERDPRDSTVQCIILNTWAGFSKQRYHYIGAKIYLGVKSLN